MSGNSRPLVSVGIPTYNGALRIEKALSSLFSQDYPNLEIIISDNASTDNTCEVCESYSRYDSRITYHRQARNLGLIPNFEYLLHVARGKYFIFLSDDDAFTPGILNTYVDFMEQHQDHVMVCGKINYWKDNELYDYESGFSLQQSNPMARALKLYQNSKLGGLIHGMFRLEMGKKLRLKSILGNDWHFLAGLAFQGKIHQFDNIVGYEKSGDGTSSNFHKYVKTMGENFIWGYMPFVKISLDTFKEILYKEKVYQSFGFFSRFFAAIYAALSVFSHYYLKIIPRTWAGRLMRNLNIKTSNQKRIAAHKAQYLSLEKESVL